MRRIFPEGAGYAHDRLERRKDLDAAQRAVEPRNGDSHLAFIAGGLQPCVTHPNRAGETVCFVDLDGVNDGRPRRRQTRVIGFHRETVAGQMRLRVPLSGHSIDSINLKTPALGLYEQLAEFVARSDVDKGRLHIALGRGERDAALTINEFETLLMKYDLAAVLKNPLRFMAEEYRQALANPRAVPRQGARLRAVRSGPRAQHRAQDARPARLPAGAGARPYPGGAGGPHVPREAIDQLAGGRRRKPLRAPSRASTRARS